MAASDDRGLSQVDLAALHFYAASLTSTEAVCGHEAPLRIDFQLSPKRPLLWCRIESSYRYGSGEVFRDLMGSSTVVATCARSAAVNSGFHDTM